MKSCSFPLFPCAQFILLRHTSPRAFASWLGIQNEKEPSQTFCTRLVVRHFKTQVNLKEVIALTADTYTHIWRSPFSIFNVLIPYFLAIECSIDVQHLPAPFLDDSFTIASPSMLHWQEDANIISPNLPSVAAENQYHSQTAKYYASLIQIRFDFENTSPQNLDIVGISMALSTTWCLIGLLRQLIGYTFHSIHFLDFFLYINVDFLLSLPSVVYLK